MRLDRYVQKYMGRFSFGSFYFVCSCSIRQHRLDCCRGQFVGERFVLRPDMLNADAFPHVARYGPCLCSIFSKSARCTCKAPSTGPGACLFRARTHKHKSYTWLIMALPLCLPNKTTNNRTNGKQASKPKTDRIPSFYRNVCRKLLPPTSPCRRRI